MGKQGIQAQRKEVSLYIYKKLVTEVAVAHGTVAESNWTMTLNTYSKSEHLSYLI